MNVTATPAPKSSVILEVEVPAERLGRAVGEATRALSRRTKVPGFRPGKAPRGVLEAVLGPGAVLEEDADPLLPPGPRGRSSGPSPARAPSSRRPSTGSSSRPIATP